VASGLRLLWSAKSEWDEWARHSEGTYLLRTNVSQWSSEELWRTYVQLTEAAFRIHKSDLSIRPVWHQKTERVQAHILVCFLAYVLWKTLEQWQRRAGLGNSPRTILEEVGHIQSTDVVLPWPTPPVASFACAASSAPTSRRRCCSIASGVDSRNDSACPHRCANSSSDSNSQIPGKPGK